MTEILAKLLGKFQVQLLNPTRDWPTRAVTSLEYDLGSQSLNGLRVETPIEGARLFGTADWFSGGRQDPNLDFRPLGLQLECFEGVIVEFRLVADPASRMGFRDRAFAPGSLILKGPGIPGFCVSKSTHEADLFRLLGKPCETGPVVGDRVHTFDLLGNIVESFHDPSTGLLVEINFSLANEAAA